MQEDGNDASQIVYDEFLECVVRCAVATYDYEFSHETDDADYRSGNKQAVVKRKHVEEGGNRTSAAMAAWGFVKKNRPVLQSLANSGTLADTVMQVTALQNIEKGPDKSVLEGNADVSETAEFRGAFEDFIDAYIEREFLVAVEKGIKSTGDEKSK